VAALGRRLLLLAALAGVLALAAVASAKPQLTSQSGTLAVDDGTSLAWTLTEPDLTPPPGGWPAIVALHWLGGTKETLTSVAQAFAAEGYAVLAYDARGHGASTGSVELAGPKEVSDLRAFVAWLAARPDVSDSKIGAWGISYGGGETWNALVAGVPLAAAEVVETWTDLYTALWPQGVPKSGIVSLFANAVITRSPLVAGLAQGAIQGTNLDVVRDLVSTRSALPRLGSVTVPVYLFQGRQDFVFDITQATQAFERLAGPKRLYIGDFGHAPSTFPGPDVGYVLTQGVQWFDRFLKGEANGIDTKAPVELAPQTWRGTAVAYPGLPPTRTTTFKLGGTTRLAGTGGAERATKVLSQPVETFGASALAVRVTRLAKYPHLVAVLSAIAANGKQTLISQGATVPHLGTNTIRFGNYAVLVPKGSKLRVTFSSTSTAQSTSNLVYLPFAGSGSISLGAATLRLSALAGPVSQ
jgi:predicted acyl esterase